MIAISPRLSHLAIAECCLDLSLTQGHPPEPIEVKIFLRLPGLPLVVFRVVRGEVRWRRVQKVPFGSRFSVSPSERMLLGPIEEV